MTNAAELLQVISDEPSGLPATATRWKPIVIAERKFAARVTLISNAPVETVGTTENKILDPP